MSHIGQKATLGSQQARSASLLKADIADRCIDVSYVPIADIIILLCPLRSRMELW
jgi:hypothetical protein